MFTIKKIFHISYGHQLFGYRGKCANLHGHNARIEVVIKAEKLNAQDMVMDFTVLGARVKKWLDANLDHKVLLSSKDPLLKTLQAKGQKCFVTEASPTAEVLARLIFEALKKQHLPVKKVSFQETETSTASYKE
ncbi:MAG: 6-carboxytetrahydropterin synthase [Elusimicrobia bacterium]|nr:6-carboxytetrahydropterin synthase [Elusimicrobiota bacterium]